MRFISKYPNYQMIIENEEKVLRLGQGGIAVHDIAKPAFSIMFDNSHMITAYERLYAMQVFIGRDPRPFGAIPETIAQPIVDYNGRVVDMTSDYRPDLNFSCFDTSTIADDRLRELAEKKLLENSTHGTDYVHVEARQVPPPWPSYAQTEMGKIAAMVEAMGADPIEVLAYEEAHENRPVVVTGLKKLLEARAKARAELDSLSAVVE